MKLVILLAISLIFVSCGRKKGPNTLASNSNATSNAADLEKKKEYKKQREATPKCDELSNSNPLLLENKTLQVRLQNQENGKTVLKNLEIKTTPVVYKQVKSKFYRVCKSDKADWKDITYPYNGYTSTSKILNKACEKIAANNPLDSQLKKLFSLANNDINEENSGFTAGFYIEVTKSDIKKVEDSVELTGELGDKYFCSRPKIYPSSF